MIYIANNTWFLTLPALVLISDFVLFHFPTSNHVALYLLGFYFQISPYATVKHFSAKINCFTCAV